VVIHRVIDEVSPAGRRRFCGPVYRAGCTVRYATAIYVLHVFQKKSKRGKATPQRDLDLIDKRLKRAAELHAQEMKESGR
jgi:phage-related protein